MWRHDFKAPPLPPPTPPPPQYTHTHTHTHTHTSPPPFVATRDTTPVGLLVGLAGAGRRRCAVRGRANESRPLDVSLSGHGRCCGRQVHPDFPGRRDNPGHLLALNTSSCQWRGPVCAGGKGGGGRMTGIQLAFINLRLFS